jgi:signal transduction histidine kinase
VSLPLLARDRLVGVLTFALDAPRRFTVDERAALEACAEIFSLGVANAARYEHMADVERLREEWTSMVAHDLRQPLNLVATTVGLLRRTAQSPDAERILKLTGHLQKAVASLGRMIGDLADASRLETKRVVLDKKPVDLGALVRDAVERHQAAVPDRGMRCTVPDRTPRVEIDPVRIEQVLGNLLENAIKYGAPGTPVDVEVHSLGDELRVQVTNHGQCIPPGEMSKVFDRYYRATCERAVPTDGLGLGLYIAKGLIEAHGGRIWADSRPETTTFLFALPVGGSRG